MLKARSGRRLAGEAAAIAVALLLGACATAGDAARPVAAEGRPAAVASDDPGAALTSFIAAARGRDFASVWGLLASPLRARYSPESLERDFGRVEQGALERLARAELAAGAAPELDGARARFAFAEGRAVLLVREPDGWKVEALE